MSRNLSKISELNANATSSYGSFVRWALALGTGLVILISVFCILPLVILGMYGPKEIAVHETEIILDTIWKNPPDKTLPNYVGEGCLTVVRMAMKENAGQHITQAVYYNLDDPNYKFRAVDEVTVHVNFPNGRKVAFHFYEGVLASCGEVKGDQN